jgi:hypothetical protein
MFSAARCGFFEFDVDIRPGRLRNPAEGLFGKLVTDPSDDAKGGHIRQAGFTQSSQRGLHEVTRIPFGVAQGESNLRNELMPLWDRVLLRERAIMRR